MISFYGTTSRLMIVSHKTKKTEAAVRDDRVSYLHIAPHSNLQTL